MLKISHKIKAFSVASATAANAPVAAPAQPALDTSDADRRIRFDLTATPTEESLKFITRPDSPAGHDARVYLVKAPEGLFNVTVVHEKNGSPNTGYPFEVWVQGDSMPRGLEAIAMNLSLDMRSVDRAWLLRKLEALKKVEGESFTMVCPDGVERRMKGAIEAFAVIVEHRLRELGCLSDEILASTPMVDAMIVRREPKTTDEGSICWYADVENPTTNDQFIVVVKEAESPEGKRIPLSVWFSGNVPRSFQGIEKLLSLDMRIVDPYWIGKKLRQLAAVHEKNGDFWALVPGGDGKRRSYPSTLAYVADLIISRYARLGLLNREGRPVKEDGVVQLALFRGKQDGAQDGALARPAPLKGGVDCPSCKGVGTMVLLDGCLTCVGGCGHSKCG
jgi:ribonucleoside-diphosphate reductase alpha chain